SVICEYLDEIADNTLHPADPLERAIGRGWVEYGVNCLQTLFHLSTTNDQQRFEQAVASFKEHMIKLDTVISSGPYFYREQFTMADAAFAPIFMRLALIDKWTNLTLFDGVPKVSSWSSQLLNRDSVQHSVVEEFPTLYRKMLESKKGVITSSLN
ncbi:MAG: glutathione S-transferase family protein, partial [Bdellovibrionales bacterium]|nr:glutathione S-transferase family protein [Bdellovibrionales bacterium]